jgi:hypothetical protein
MIERPLGSRAAKGPNGEQEPRPSSIEQPRSSNGSGARRRRVLFALTELEYPTPALRRVAAMATAIDGDLYVLRVLTSLPAIASRSFAGPPAELDERRACLATLGTIAWWRRTLLSPCAEEKIRVRIGDFAIEVPAHARLLGAVCVVLAPAPPGRPSTMTALMRACRRPVFSTPAAGQEWAALLVAAKAADRR